MKLILAIAMLLTTVAIPRSKRQILLHTANVVNLRGPITTKSVTSTELKIAQQSSRLNSRAPLYLVIDSPGGSIDAGEGLIEFIKGYPNVQVICIFCASMAHAILQAVNNKRLVIATSTLMAHRARLRGLGGQVEAGELESRLAMIKKQVRKMERRNAYRIGISLASYKAKVLNEWWTSGHEIISSNSADEIVEIKCMPSLIRAVEKITQRSLFRNVTRYMSKCPLIQGSVK